MLLCCWAADVFQSTSLWKHEWRDRKDYWISLLSKMIPSLQGHSSGHKGNGETVNIFQAEQHFFFFFPFVTKWKASQRDMLWFWSVQDVFYESLWSRNVQRFPLGVRNTKEDTVRRSCDVLLHNKDVSVPPASSLAAQSNSSVRLLALSSDRWGLSLRRMRPLVVKLQRLAMHSGKEGRQDLRVQQ